MTRRYVAVVLEFEDDEALAEFQRAGKNRELTNAVQSIVYEGRVEGVRDLVQHPSAPYIYDMTVRGLKLRA